LATAGAAAGLAATGRQLFAEDPRPHTASGTDPVKGPYVGTAPPPVEKPVKGADPAAPPKKEAVLKLCSQDSRVPGKTLKEKVDLLLKWGASGIEFGGIDVATAERLRKELDGTGLAPAALCWGSADGDLVSIDLAKRKAGIQRLKDQLQAAGALGATGVIFVPTFNGQSDLKPDEITKILLDILPGIAEYAVKVRSRVLLEPLNKGETFYLTRLEQAADLCRKVASPGLAMMGDFYHMGLEEKDDEAAFVAAGPHLHHVHLASRGRNLPGQDNRSFLAGFRGLKRIGYQDFCSLECDPKGDAKVEIPKSFDFLRKQWQEAMV
jgi:sugar phosphate isomerase/epimerase